MKGRARAAATGGEMLISRLHNLINIQVLRHRLKYFKKKSGKSLSTGVLNLYLLGLELATFDAISSVLHLRRNGNVCEIAWYVSDTFNIHHE